MEKKLVLGIICVILASIAFGVAPVFTKELILSGMDTLSIMMYSPLSALLVVGIVMLVRGLSLKVTKTQLWQLFLFCGCSNSMAAYLLFSAYRFLPIGLATMFHFIYPTIVTIIMMAAFKEKVSAMKVITIVMAFVGLGLIFDLSGRMSLLGVALALGSGLSYAIYVVATRKSAYNNLPIIVLVFYSSILSVVLIAIYQLATRQLIIPVKAWEWLMISANGLVGNLFAYAILIVGIRRIGPSNAAIANMLEPLTALVAGAVIYGDRIEFKALFGCILVILAIMLIPFHDRFAQEKPRKE